MDHTIGRKDQHHEYVLATEKFVSFIQKAGLYLGFPVIITFLIWGSRVPKEFEHVRTCEIIIDKGSGPVKQRQIAWKIFTQLFGAHNIPVSQTKALTTREMINYMYRLHSTCLTRGIRTRINRSLLVKEYVSIEMVLTCVSCKSLPSSHRLCAKIGLQVEGSMQIIHFSL